MIAISGDILDNANKFFNIFNKYCVYLLKNNDDSLTRVTDNENIDKLMCKNFNDDCSNYRDFINKVDIDQLLNISFNDKYNSRDDIQEILKSNLLRAITTRIRINDKTLTLIELAKSLKYTYDITNRCNVYSDTKYACKKLTKFEIQYKGCSVLLLVLCGEEYFIRCEYGKYSKNISSRLAKAYVDNAISKKYTLKYYKHICNIVSCFVASDRIIYNEINNIIKDLLRHPCLRSNSDLNFKYTEYDKNNLDNIFNKLRDVIQKYDIDILLNYEFEHDIFYIHEYSISWKRLMKTLALRLNIDITNPTIEEIENIFKYRNKIKKLISIEGHNDEINKNKTCLYLMKINKKYPGNAAVLYILCGQYCFLTTRYIRRDNAYISFTNKYFDLFIPQSHCIETYKNVNKAIENISNIYM